MSADLIGDDACREAFNKARQQRFSVHGLDVVCEPDIFRSGYAAGRDSEIAKRDARMAELEKELQAGATAVENCELFRAELAAIKAPARDITAAVDAAMIEMANISPPVRRNECERLIRAALNAVPVRQVSVPDVLREAIKWADHLCFECGALVQTRAPSVHVYNKTFEAVQAAKAMLAAAPAAAAADAGDIVLNASAQEILSQCIGAHAYVLGVLANGRPDLAFIEAKKWVDAFKKAATQMEPSHD